MQQITIKSVKLEGFRSFVSPVSFPFGTTGLHLIKGGNGEGKTTIFSALAWCLYKINLNDTPNAKIPTWKWRRTNTYLGTRVIVILGIGKYKYLIARHMDYKGKTRGLDGENTLLIFRKEKADKNPISKEDIVNDELYKSDQQAYLNRLLGVDGKTFLNSVVFGQRMTRLMASKNEDKRDLFEKLFDAEFIDILRERAVAKLTGTNNALQLFRQDHAGVEASFIHLTQQLEQATNIETEFKSQRKVALAIIREDHTIAKTELQSTLQLITVAEKKVAKQGKTSVLNVLLDDADTKREAFYDAKERLNNLRRDIDDLSRQVTASELAQNKLWEQLKLVKDTCPTCGGKLDDKQVSATKKKIEQDIKDEVKVERTIEQKIVNLRASEVNLQAEYNISHEAFTLAMQSYDEAKDSNVITGSSQNELLALQQKKNLLTERIKNLVAAYNAEKERKPPTVNIPELQTTLAKVEANKLRLEKSIRIHNNLSKRLEWWVKNAFNANGLKAFVFSAMLNKLNECLSVYTEYFGYSVVFGIDLSKPSKPFFGKVTLDGEHEVDYSELSGGQKQKIDLCIAFAMHDSISVKSSFNLIIFDEAAEGLDIEAQEMFDTLLRMKADKKAVYVISHNNQMDLSGAVEYEVVGGNKKTSTIQ